MPGRGAILQPRQRWKRRRRRLQQGTATRPAFAGIVPEAALQPLVALHTPLNPLHSLSPVSAPLDPAEIVPEASLEPVVAMYTPEAEEALLAGDPDFVLDAIDNIDTKASVLPRSGLLCD